MGSTIASSDRKPKPEQKLRRAGNLSGKAAAMQKTIASPISIADLEGRKKEELLSGSTVLRRLEDQTTKILIEGMIQVSELNGAIKLTIDGRITIGSISYTGRTIAGVFLAGRIDTPTWKWCDGRVWIHGHLHKNVIELSQNNTYLTTAYGGLTLQLSIVPWKPNSVIAHDRLHLFFEHWALCKLENERVIVSGMGHYIALNGELWQLTWNADSPFILGRQWNRQVSIRYPSDQFWRLLAEEGGFARLHSSLEETVIIWPPRLQVRSEAPTEVIEQPAAPSPAPRDLAPPRTKTNTKEPAELRSAALPTPSQIANLPQLSIGKRKGDKDHSSLHHSEEEYEPEDSTNSEVRPKTAKHDEPPVAKSAPEGREIIRILKELDWPLEEAEPRVKIAPKRMQRVLRSLSIPATPNTPNQYLLQVLRHKYLGCSYKPPRLQGASRATVKILEHSLFAQSK